MRDRVYLNARFMNTDVTGVQRTAWSLYECLLKENIELVVVKPPKWASKGLLGHFWEQLILPYITRKAKLLSLTNTGPILHSNHWVMIHDVAFLKYPDWFGFKFKILYSFLIASDNSLKNA